MTPSHREGRSRSDERHPPTRGGPSRRVAHRGGPNDCRRRANEEADRTAARRRVCPDATRRLIAQRRALGRTARRHRLLRGRTVRRHVSLRGRTARRHVSLRGRTARQHRSFRRRTAQQHRSSARAHGPVASLTARAHGMATPPSARAHGMAASLICEGARQGGSSARAHDTA